MSSTVELIENTASSKRDFSLVFYYTSGLNYVSMKTIFGDLTIETFNKLESNDVLKEINVLMALKSSLVINLGTLRKVPYQLGYLYTTINEKERRVLENIELPYQKGLFLEEEIYDDSRNLSLSAVNSRINETLRDKFNTAVVEGLLSPVIDYSKLFLLGVENSEEYLQELQESREFYKSFNLRIPVVKGKDQIALNLGQDYTLLEDFIKENFAVTPKLKDVDTLKTDFSNDLEENNSITTKGEKATKTTYLYVDAENVSVGELTRLMASLYNDTEKFHLKVICNDKTLAFTRGWNALYVEMENVTVEVIAENSVIEGKSIVDLVLTVELMKDKDKNINRIICSSDSDFYLIAKELDNVRIAYLNSTTSSRYLDKLRETEIDTINIESIEGNITTYTGMLKGILSKDVLNVLVTLPLTEWYSLEDKITLLVKPKDIIGTSGVELDNLVKEVYTQVIDGVEIDMKNSVVRYGGMELSI